MKCSAAYLLDHLITSFAGEFPKHLGIAVSGGGDSVALLHLARVWADQGGPTPVAVTVDHGLRPGAADEAAQVATLCESWKITHHLLQWRDWDGAGNLPDQARRARYRLIAEWGKTAGVSDVALGHTRDDQAETFLMRLAREAGVDGLAAMAAEFRQGEMRFHRPLLDVSRAELRQYLVASGIDWVEDPTNTDDSFERARVRKALGPLSEIGITARSLSKVAHHMSEVRATLYWYVFLAARNSVSFECGDVLVDRKGFRTLPKEITRRLVQEILKWISGAEYAPRGRAVLLMLEAIRGGTGMTLQGVSMSVSPDVLRFTRELQAVADTRSTPGTVWDDRWILEGPWPDGAYVAALGEAGAAQCSDIIETDLPHRSRLASPAVWRDGHLVAAPLAGYAQGWQARLSRDEDAFFAALLAH